MLILPGSWELASLLGKLFLYAGAASLAGGALTAWRYSTSNRAILTSNYSYILIGSLLGFQGVVLSFFVQVGLVNDSGIAGMFDPDMSSILLATTLGEVTFYRLLGFVLAAASSIYFLQISQRPALTLASNPGRVIFGLQFIALFLLAYSHRVSGHVSVLSVIAQAAVVAHFFAFAAWIGCLLPFLQLSRSLDIESLQTTLKQFGNNAIVILLVLVLAGGLMLLELLGSPMELLNTDYGLSLLAKFFLVLVLLCVAAANKFILVPALSSKTGVAKLQTSIRYEIFLAAALLMVTAYLSTIIGPVGH